MAGYSEMGRRPEKTSFSMTCNLLSQYIKEKGCPADLGFGMLSLGLDPAAKAKPETHRPPTTMSLLPGVNVVGDERAGVTNDALARSATGSMELFPPLAVSIPYSKQPEKAQLTMFYGGEVVVFDDFPAEKAWDLMKLASQGPTAAASGKQNFFSPLTAVADHPISPSPVNSPPASFPPRPKSSDLPIARKASLHRFLEKRKDRINARTPYQKNGGGEASEGGASLQQEEISRPWLGLGSQVSNSSR